MTTTAAGGPVLTLQRRYATWAGVVWAGAGVLYLSVEALAASRSPGYSYAEDYISELGVPDAGSPLAALMNIGGFMAHGVLFLLAALVVGGATRVPGRTAFVVLAFVHAVGNVLVGLVHTGSAEDGGTAPLHAVGAAMAIVGGNLAVLAGARSARRIGAPPAYTRLSLAAGSLGLLSLALLVLGPDAVPVGVPERLSVYTITGWELGTGAALLRWSWRRRTRPGSAGQSAP